MDIRYLECFVEIVKSNCNLSAAAKKLCISQPALSTIIRNFEAEENVYLFERYNGRLQKLTPCGEIFLKNAVQILESYQIMLIELRESSAQNKGKIKIGIPPFILSLLFSDVLPSMILENPNIEFEIIELGAYGLKDLLISKSLDFSVLLHPMKISSVDTKEHVLVNSELTAFMSADNPLAANKKIDWQDLKDYPLALLNDTFMIHHHVIEKFKAQDISPNVRILSSCWPFMMLSTKNTDIVTILPSSISELIKIPNVVKRRFNDPLPWIVVLHQPKKSHYSHIEKHTLNTLLSVFNNDDVKKHKRLLPVDVDNGSSLL